MRRWEGVLVGRPPNEQKRSRTRTVRGENSCGTGCWERVQYTPKCCFKSSFSCYMYSVVVVVLLPSTAIRVAAAAQYWRGVALTSQATAPFTELFCERDGRSAPVSQSCSPLFQVKVTRSPVRFSFSFSSTSSAPIRRCYPPPRPLYPCPFHHSFLVQSLFHRFLSPFILE